MRRFLGILASTALACGPSTSAGDGGSTGDDTGTTAASTAPVMTTVGDTTGDPPGTTTDTGTTGDTDTTGPLDPSTSLPPDDTTDTGDTDTDTDTDTDSTASTGEVGNGECTEHADCPSGYCREFSDAPPDPESLCQDPPAGGNTRFTGTVRDIVTLDPVDGAEVVVTGALQALTNPSGAMALVSATADGEGHFDGTSAVPVMQAIGAVAIVSSADHFLTETGVASPQMDGSYPPGNTIHDLWAAHTDDLEAWSVLLQADGAPLDALPLGEAGGFIVIVRDATGEPVADATVVSTDGGSQAEVYYPSSDGMGLVSQTSDLGIAIVLDVSLAEVFTVQAGGASTQLTSGSVPGAIFTGGVIVD